jgi:hypothetical protein
LAERAQRGGLRSRLIAAKRKAVATRLALGRVFRLLTFPAVILWLGHKPNQLENAFSLRKALTLQPTSAAITSATPTPIAVRSIPNMAQSRCRASNVNGFPLPFLSWGGRETKGCPLLRLGKLWR